MKKHAEKNTKKRGKIYLLRFILTVLFLGMTAFIFFNSLSIGEESSKQSGFVTRLVQKTVGIFAPNCWIATATGGAYARLESIIRTLAHFLEFALWGALLIWTFRAYTNDKYAFIVCACLIVLFPILDETLQAFTSGRVADVKDLYVDTLGAICGGLFATLSFWIGKAIVLKKRRKKKIV